VDDPFNYRAESARLIIDIMMNSVLFREASSEYKNGIVIGIERGILNYSVTFIQNKNQIASWNLHVFVHEYKKKRYILLCMLEKIGTKEYTYLEHIIISRTIEWHLLAFAKPFELNPVQFAELINTQKARLQITTQM
jgi:hypothetical protein